MNEKREKGRVTSRITFSRGSKRQAFARKNRSNYKLCGKGKRGESLVEEIGLVLRFTKHLLERARKEKGMVFASKKGESAAARRENPYSAERGKDNRASKGRPIYTRGKGEKIFDQKKCSFR